MRQAGHTVLFCHGLQLDHDELLVVSCHIGIFIDGRQLKLAGRNLVMPRLDGYTQLEEFAFNFHDQAEDTLRNRPEIMIVELLPLSR